MLKGGAVLFKAVVIVGFIASAAVTQASAAEQRELAYDLYNLSASAQSEVKNDLMTVTLFAQAEGSVAAEVADSLNGTMAWALTRLKPFTTIKTETQNYRTNPKYAGKPSRIIGWNAVQTLQLQSSDFEAMATAMQKLQERLQIQGMQLSVKPSTRQKAEDALINEAMNAFKQRALLVQQNMGAPGYRIVNVNIGTNNYAPQHRQFDMQARGASTLSQAPAIEGGDSQIDVRIDGSIQLEQ